MANIGRSKGPLEGPVMAGFAGRLDEINALADQSPGIDEAKERLASLDAQGPTDFAFTFQATFPAPEL
jgi:hypothetical protein